MVAAQRAVDLVEHRVRAAMGAVAFPAAVVASQHGRVATPVEQHHHLFAPGDALAHGIHQRRGQHGLFGLLVHVHQPQAGQGTTAHAFGHVQAQVAPLLGSVPAFQRRCGRPQHHPAMLPSHVRFQLAPVHRQIARRITRPFLALVAGVVFLVHHNQPQVRQAGKHRHAGAQHNACLS